MSGRLIEPQGGPDPEAICRTHPVTKVADPSALSSLSLGASAGAPWLMRAQGSRWRGMIVACQ